jgi:hypothetical protein
MAANVQHLSVANADVQARRAATQVPGGLPLHQYANIYFYARNPMMFSLREQHPYLCVLSIHPSILDVVGVVIADRNASSDYVRFAPAATGLVGIDRERVFAVYWTHSDPIEARRHKSEMCAEVLVPGGILPRYIQHAYVSCNEAGLSVLGNWQGLPVYVNPNLFFQ